MKGKCLKEWRNCHTDNCELLKYEGILDPEKKKF
jgi:hypothetical protein